MAETSLEPESGKVARDFGPDRVFRCTAAAVRQLVGAWRQQLSPSDFHLAKLPNSDVTTLLSSLENSLVNSLAGVRLVHFGSARAARPRAATARCDRVLRPRAATARYGITSAEAEAAATERMHLLGGEWEWPRRCAARVTCWLRSVGGLVGRASTARACAAGGTRAIVHASSRRRVGMASALRSQGDLLAAQRRRLRARRAARARQAARATGGGAAAAASRPWPDCAWRHTFRGARAKRALRCAMSDEEVWTGRVTVSEVIGSCSVRGSSKHF